MYSKFPIPLASRINAVMTDKKEFVFLQPVFSINKIKQQYIIVFC